MSGRQSKNNQDELRSIDWSQREGSNALQD